MWTASRASWYIMGTWKLCNRTRGVLCLYDCICSQNAEYGLDILAVFPPFLCSAGQDLHRVQRKHRNLGESLLLKCLNWVLLLTMLLRSLHPETLPCLKAFTASKIHTPYGALNIIGTEVLKSNTCSRRGHATGWLFPGGWPQSIENYYYYESPRLSY